MDLYLTRRRMNQNIRQASGGGWYRDLIWRIDRNVLIDLIRMHNINTRDFGVVFLALISSLT